MNLRIYLLKLSLRDCGYSKEELLEALELRVDESRREKAKKLRTAKAKLISLSAGLLLQKMVLDGSEEPVWSTEPISLTLQDLLQEIETPVQLCISYGENGKPYLADRPLHFNLSHSGDTILLAVSDREIGADIQEKLPKDIEKLSNRFFAPCEAGRLAAMSPELQNDYFYKLWTGKEAYTKLLGATLGQNLATDVETLQNVSFIEIVAGTDYSACVCTFL